MAIDFVGGLIIGAVGMLLVMSFLFMMAVGLVASGQKRLQG